MAQRTSRELGKCGWVNKVIDVRDLCEGIHDRTCELALLFGHRRHCSEIDGGCLGPQTLVIREEEGFVVAIVEMWNEDGTAEHIAKLVLSKRRVLAPGAGKIALCVKIVVPEEVVGCAVDLVCARPCAYIELVGAPAVSSGVTLCLLLKFLQNIDRWNDSGRLVIRVVDIDAVEKILI